MFRYFLGACPPHKIVEKGACPPHKNCGKRRVAMDLSIDIQESIIRSAFCAPTSSCKDILRSNAPLALVSTLWKQTVDVCIRRLLEAFSLNTYKTSRLFAILSTSQDNETHPLVERLFLHSPIPRFIHDFLGTLLTAIMPSTQEMVEGFCEYQRILLQEGQKTGGRPSPIVVAYTKSHAKDMWMKAINAHNMSVGTELHDAPYVDFLLMTTSKMYKSISFFEYVSPTTGRSTHSFCVFHSDNRLRACEFPSTFYVLRSKTSSDISDYHQYVDNFTKYVDVERAICQDNKPLTDLKRFVGSKWKDAIVDLNERALAYMHYDSHCREAEFICDEK